MSEIIAVEKGHHNRIREELRMSRQAFRLAKMDAKQAAEARSEVEEALVRTSQTKDAIASKLRREASKVTGLEKRVRRLEALLEESGREMERYLIRAEEAESYIDTVDRALESREQETQQLRDITRKNKEDAERMVRDAQILLEQERATARRLEQTNIVFARALKERDALLDRYESLGFAEILFYRAARRVEDNAGSIRRALERRVPSITLDWRNED